MSRYSHTKDIVVQAIKNSKVLGENVNPFIGYNAYSDTV